MASDIWVLSILPHTEWSCRSIDIVMRRLKACGLIDVGGGKHDKFEHPDRPDTIIVPRHKELSPGVARSIAKLAGWL